MDSANSVNSKAPIQLDQDRAGFASPAGIPSDHGGRIWEAALNLGVRPDEILDYSANLNPLGPPPGVLRVIEEHLGEIVHYPEPFSSTLARAIASHRDVSPSMVVVGNGASELIYSIVRAIRPKTVLIPSPTFSEYQRAALVSSAKTDLIPVWDAETARIDVGTIAQVLRRKHYDMLFLCNPNNPTGNLLDPDSVRFIWEACVEAKTYMILDESFLGFVDNAEALSGLALLRSKKAENLVILDSFTKLFSLPGLRLGYAIGDPKVLVAVNAGRDPWSVNRLAQVAAIRCLEETGYVLQTQKTIAAARSDLIGRLRRLDETVDIAGAIRPFDSAPNFILCRLGDGITSRDLATLTAKEGILIRDCSTFPYLGTSAGPDGPKGVSLAIPSRLDKQRTMADKNKLNPLAACGVAYGPGAAEGCRFIRLAVRLPADNERLVAVLAQAVRYLRATRRSFV
ncbi:MAG TPA: pyridoxal phosphate-dependent class II aminotransferase [Clostridia bacterium]|nr:pyridoxal phosphate-dependent class II aminotransferase [Clostridia bacterium]